MEHRILLMRSGSTAGREQGLYTSMNDEPLSQKGRSVIDEKREKGAYPGVRLIYTSPMLRCRETALAFYPNVPAIVTTGLSPLDMGNYTGMNYRGLLQDKQFQLWSMVSEVQPLGGGEDPYRFQARCTLAFHGILKEIRRKRIENIAVFTHNAVISNIMQRFCIPRDYYKEWSVGFGEGYLLRLDSASGLISMESKI